MKNFTNHKIWGVLALIGAPALLIGSQLEQTHKTISNNWLIGIWGIIYISAWTANIAALRQIQATGTSRFGKNILWIITGTLILANIFNVYEIIAPNDNSIWYKVLDSSWPISNLLMLVVGFMVIKAKVLTGWKRYVPLIVGLWLPITLLTMALAGRDAPIMVFVPYYTAIAWSLLAVVSLTFKVKAAAPAQLYTRVPLLN